MTEIKLFRIWSKLQRILQKYFTTLFLHFEGQRSPSKLQTIRNRNREELRMEIGQKDKTDEIQKQAQTKTHSNEIKLRGEREGDVFTKLFTF